ncbi:UDP-glucose 4-epimerase GalE [Amylibacter kogurei]|uniref:UDP-glucose 4-epimerase n=1 Tax=Paramylibacter kogurei TaxID=1889778 RepID=A0A2G5KAQ6_9RHOB|nr:UDP-glucose 4-epimerase GalE [Amylibacter kogurei]PIB26525.1 UDP-glucose 4-epimerase GalE [Amylibacter kogurei]
MTKVLLTGGAGFIGSHTYVALVEAGFDVVIVDNFVNANTSVIDRLGMITKQDVIFETADLREISQLDAVFDKHKPDAVVHFAAFKAVGESVENPLMYFENNIKGFLNLLRAMENHNARHLVFSSSATIYGDQAVQPIPETATRGYTSPYAFTKLIGEQILEQMADADANWKFGILRYFNPAGAHDSGLIGEDPTGIPDNLMPYIAKVALGEMEHLNVFGNDYDTKDGTGIRDYIHVCDLALAHVKSLQKLIADQAGHTVNIGTGAGQTVMDMLAAYGTVVGRELPHKLADRRAGDVRELTARADLAKQILGFRAERDLANMCETSWRWVQNAQRMNSK